MLKEFKEFALRGNVMDLAVGVIIGAAFGTIVNSVVNDLIMPLVGIAFKADFSNFMCRFLKKYLSRSPLIRIFRWQKQRNLGLCSPGVIS